MPELIPLAEARRQVLAGLAPLPAEDVALREALGRVLAEDVEAPLDVPPFDSSAMDGFAVPEPGPGELRLAGESRAGAPTGGRLEPGTAVRISTGAEVPEGTAAVVPVERAEAADGVLRFPGMRPGANVRRAGEDVRAGQPVLGAGTRLGPAEVGMLASLGRAAARCARRPLVALVVTGDELAQPGEPLGPGRIYSSNAAALAAQVERAGGELVSSRTVPDEPTATRDALAAALEAGDAVCVSGGVSVGEHDHVKAALHELGVEERFWGIALKPGKPTWFGRAGARPVFGLPGNPVSAMVTFHLLARPALLALQGAHDEPKRLRAALARPVERSRKREQAVRVRLRDGHAEPTGGQGSHRLSSMLGADGLALISPGEGTLEAGEEVEVDPL